MNFSLPQNTILGSKKKIILSPHITGFSIEDKSSLKLMTPQSEVVYSYLTPIIPAPVLPKTTSPAVKPLKVPEDKIDEVFEEDLSASVVNSESNNNYLPMFVFVLFLGTTSSAVYFIRSKKKPILSGDDFELIDE
jgi:hypothetical protein